MKEVASMQKVFLITGFNNWGKTTLLKDIFGTGAFRKGVAETFAGYSFLVMPQSNDDLGKLRYEREYRERLRLYATALGTPKYIAAAFCPTKERRNSSAAIIRGLFPKARIEMLLLEYKWCNQAKLLPSEVTSTYATERNVSIHVLSSRTRPGKEAAAKSIFRSCLP